MSNENSISEALCVFEFVKSIYNFDCSFRFGLLRYGGNPFKVGDDYWYSRRIAIPFSLSLLPSLSLSLSQTHTWTATAFRLHHLNCWLVQLTVCSIDFTVTVVAIIFFNFHIFLLPSFLNQIFGFSAIPDIYFPVAQFLFYFLFFFNKKQINPLKLLEPSVNEKWEKNSYGTSARNKKQSVHLYTLFVQFRS